MVDFTGTLQTARLTLRPLAEGDLADIHSYQRLPSVVQYMLWSTRTLDQSREHLTRRMTMTRLAVDGDVLVVAAVLDGHLIGEITIFLHSVANRQAEIGWAFHPDFQGQGYASEAAGRMLDYAFTEVNAHRVIANLDPRNAASAALARRLGMRQEAHFRESLFTKGGWADTAIFAVLRSEWVAEPGPAGAPGRADGVGTSSGVDA